MEALARYSGGMRVFLWRLGLANRGLTAGDAPGGDAFHGVRNFAGKDSDAVERVSTGLSDRAAYGQTQSPSVTVLPGTPPSSFSFQPTE
jgi:hypothetical protein